MGGARDTRFFCAVLLFAGFRDAVRLRARILFLPAFPLRRLAINESACPLSPQKLFKLRIRGKRSRMDARLRDC